MASRRILLQSAKRASLAPAISSVSSAIPSASPFSSISHSAVYHGYNGYNGYNVTSLPLASTNRPAPSPLLVSSRRWQSSVTTESANAASSSGKCPITGRSSAKPSTDQDGPTLQHVPSLPLFGSLLNSYSKIPPMDKAYTFWPTMRANYGDFYTFGLPGLGDSSNGILPSIFGSLLSHHTVYVIQDPKEMAKVIRSEGSYPSGLAQSSWALFRWQKYAGFEMVSQPDGGFAGQGADWKRLRSFMQTDLLHPEAARGYRSILIEAAEMASCGAPASADAINSYLERCAFDMFSAVTFGEQMNCADSTTPTAPEDEEFVYNAKEGLRTGVSVARSVRDMILVKQFGIETEHYLKMKQHLDKTWEIGTNKIERFMEKRAKAAQAAEGDEGGERGEEGLTETEKNSYLFRALERYDSGESSVSIKELKELAWAGIFAAVDTTSGKMAWNILHAALNPEVQEKLYQELKASTAKVGINGKLTAEALDKANAPYLHQFIRESHRITPVSPIATKKHVASTPNSKEGLDIHGLKLPIGSAVLLDGYSLGVDPDLVENPKEFRPERWSDESVSTRKGTKKEVIDHPFFKDPFSQGARKCPGSRVALNEVAVLLSQLLLDYKISAPEGMTLDDVEAKQVTVVEPVLPKLTFERRV